MLDGGMFAGKTTLAIAVEWMERAMRSRGSEMVRQDSNTVVLD